MAKPYEDVSGGAVPPGIDFRQLVALVSDPIAVHDERGVIVWANAAAAALVRAPGPEALLGTPMLSFVAPELRAFVAARAAELAARGGTAETAEETFIRLDGSQVEVETSAAALGGGLTAVVVRDVSRRVRSERETRTAVSRLRSLFELSSEAIGLSRDGLHVMVNPAHARLFGYDRPEQLVGVPVTDLVARQDRERLLARRAQPDSVAAPATLTLRGLRRDGTEFDIEVRTSAFPEDGGHVSIAVIRDVTEPRRLERELRESERRFRDLFEFVPVSLFEVDASGIRATLDRLREEGVADLRAHFDGRPELVARLMGEFEIVAVNAAGRAMVGAGSMEELLANLDKIFPPETFARYREAALQFLDGRTTVQAEGWSGTISGARRWIETTATVVPGHEASWGRILFASADVTERRRADEERAALQERLRQAEKLEAVGRLAGGIAHDFNNILSGILGYTELTLLGLAHGSELHDHQQRIREATLRARDLVRQILAFSRRDSANRRVVDVPTVVAEALTLMRAGIPASVTLETRIDPDAGTVLADPTQLHQIVLNLASNARDAVSAYGRILIAVDAAELKGELPGLPSGRYVRLRVRDDGAGMDAATRERLFEPYMTTKAHSGGHGLGLAVVHGIVAATGGAIQVESSPGAGSTFDVYLPRSELPPARESAPARQAGGRGERVLVVDDDPMVRSAHRRLLESLGYAVEVASDGEEALARFREAPEAFDLVLTDQTMPRLSGVDLARAVLGIRGDAAVILCTGYSDRVDEERARALGLRALLPKPIGRDAMGAAVRRALGGR